MTHIVAISAGISVPSSTRILADSLGRATVNALSVVENGPLGARTPLVVEEGPLGARTPLVVEEGLLGARLETTATYDVIELRDLAHQITDAMLTGFATGALADAVRRVTTADAVIAVSPIYTGSYSGLFKSFVDVLEDGTLEGKPVLIAATAGTARHSLVLEFAMRPLFAYLKADVVPTAVFAASEDFGSGSLAGGSLSTRIDRAARELADTVLRRGSTLPKDPFDDPTPFEDLLRDI
jgi:FMN reductase